VSFCIAGPLFVLSMWDEHAHDNEDSAGLGRVVLHCRAALCPLDVGRTS